MRGFDAGQFSAWESVGPMSRRSRCGASIATAGAVADAEAADARINGYLNSGSLFRSRLQPVRQLLDLGGTLLL